MLLSSPEWLIFLPLLVLAGWVWKRLQLWKPLRVICLVLLTLILVRPQIPRFGEGQDVWVLMDRSPSAADLLEPRRAEMETLLSRSKGARDRMFLVDYGASVALRDEADAAHAFDPGRETRSALAVHHVLARLDPDRASRLLLVTDGYSSEPMKEAGERLARQRVPLDFRLLKEGQAGDYRVADLRLPGRVQMAEPFLIESRIAGEPDADVSYVVTRDNQPVSEGTLAIRKGQGLLRFTDGLVQSGSHRYAIEVRAPDDSHTGNNRSESWVEVVGGPRILLVTLYEADPLVRVLGAQGFEVETVRELDRLHVGQLAGTKAVILNNVPAYRLPPEFLGALDFYVRGQGGGLLMAGGKFSFGSGGYFNSPVDALLPVSMELRQEHRKLAVAMAIVMDRSGSMSAGVATPSGSVTKMDLANEGAARAVELLGDNDAITVFAVDSEAHEIVPLSRVGSNRDKLIDTIRRIHSTGGGIFVYTGLKAAWEQLKTSKVGQRHVILFADAADAEEPGEYLALLDEMTRAGVTVSVIGLGSDTDVDAHFLRDVAYFGKGRIFFNANPMELPALFAQETVAVARSAFVEEPTPLLSGAGWLEIAARQLTWPKAVDGYNLSYLKPGATAAAVTEDSYSAPLLAFWHRGVGRVGAVSFPLGGDFSTRVRGWNEYGDFLQTLARWLMGEEVPEGLSVLTRWDAGELDVSLYYDETWEEKVSRSAPRLFATEGVGGDVRQLVWSRLRPGQYRSAVPVRSGQWLWGAVQVGSHSLPFGPVTAGLDPEWNFDPARVQELQEVSRISGGQERLDLATIWQAPRTRQYQDIRAGLTTALLAFFLLEALATRLGWRLPLVRRAADRAAETGPVAKTPVVRRVAPARPASGAPPFLPPQPGPAESRRSRFQRAKRGGV